MNKPRGMRVLYGNDAARHRDIINDLVNVATRHGYMELSLPSVWGLKTFTDKAGNEIINQIYHFKDKKGRDLCLTPEATCLTKEVYDAQGKRPMRVFYVHKCYRYERPQKGRYREFTQFGLECLGYEDNTSEILDEMMMTVINSSDYIFNTNVSRGLDYYTGKGFEVECPSLGAQKQVAGGGAYNGGEGFAIGVDRLALVNQEE